MADTPKRASDVLREAKALISTPERWTQRMGARNARGEQVDVTNPDAICWCLSGAIYKFTREYSSPAAEVVKAMVGSIVDWNDASGRTHDDVINLLNRAIFLAETEEANG